MTDAASHGWNFRSRRQREFKINGITELADEGIDATAHILRLMHAQALAMANGMSESERENGSLNVEIVERAFQSLAYMAALAAHHLCERGRL